ncbi:MAG: hypothetical protein C0505_00565 [Leptothrix sp. (in: Bacteria)]|nr:hypothetical protein [Leptothrix sp. (in: b-proteobacteria)]
MDDTLDRITTFLNAIGLPVLAGEVPAVAFLPGVRIAHGTLVFDATQLRWPGDLLHEAGHLAVTPAHRRAALDGALEGDDADARATEVVAIAWSWAALVHLGLPGELLFHEGGYGGRAAGLRMTFEMGVYPGVPALAAAGMTMTGDAALAAGAAPYPQMQRWLQD